MKDLEQIEKAFEAKVKKGGIRVKIMQKIHEGLLALIIILFLIFILYQAVKPDQIFVDLMEENNGSFVLIDAKGDWYLARHRVGNTFTLDPIVDFFKPEEER